MVCSISLPVDASRLFVRTNNDKLEITSAIHTTVPLSIAAWIYPVTTGISQGIVSIDTDGTADNRHVLLISATNVINVNTRTASTGTAASTSTVTANTWSHVGGSWAATNSRRAYFNGVQEGTSATNLDPSLMNRTRIGVYFTSSFQHFNGRIADVCIWSADLTTSEFAAMYAGKPCTQIRSESLVACPVLWGIHDPEIDACAARSWPIVGTPTRAPHPPIGLFTRP